MHSVKSENLYSQQNQDLLTSREISHAKTTEQLALVFPKSDKIGEEQSGTGHPCPSFLNMGKRQTPENLLSTRSQSFKMAIRAMAREHLKMKTQTSRSDVLTGRHQGTLPRSAFLGRVVDGQTQDQCSHFKSWFKSDTQTKYFLSSMENCDISGSKREQMLSLFLEKPCKKDTIFIPTLLTRKQAQRC